MGSRSTPEAAKPSGRPGRVGRVVPAIALDDDDADDDAGDTGRADRTGEVLPLREYDFDAFFRQSYAPLVRALTVVCGSREEAADAVQDAFVRAHQRWSTISAYDDPAAWVRRVAINRVRDVFRRDARGRRARLRLAGDAQAIPAPEPDSSAAQTALRELPRQQRVAMALYYVHELSVAEVAAAMELTEGAVKYHLHQGRNRLRERLEGGDA
jgi:RNA polymerase sigma-70 factor, ECF subfamily